MLSDRLYRVTTLRQEKNSMVSSSCQKGPTRHAYAWQIGPYWQDTFELWISSSNTYHILI